MEHVKLRTKTIWLDLSIMSYPQRVGQGDALLGMSSMAVGDVEGGRGLWTVMMSGRRWEFCT